MLIQLLVGALVSAIAIMIHALATYQKVATN